MSEKAKQCLANYKLKWFYFDSNNLHNHKQHKIILRKSVPNSIKKMPFHQKWKPRHRVGIEKFVKGQTRTSNSPLKRTKRDILRKPKNWIKKLWHIEDFVNMQSLLFLSESKRSDGKKAGGFLIPSDTISLFPFREGMRKKSEKIRFQKSLRFPLGIPHYIFSYPTKPLYFLVFQHLSYSLSGERRGKRRKEWEVSLYLW